MSERPFEVLGVQQIAIGGADKSALRHLWIDLLGLVPTGTYRSEAENVDEDIALCGDVEVDLMQPIDPEGRPAVHRPPLNHVGLWVSDLVQAKAWLESQGVQFAGGIRGGASGHDVAFIHPKRGGEGVLIELVQAPAEMLERDLPQENVSG